MEESVVGSNKSKDKETRKKSRTSPCNPIHPSYSLCSFSIGPTRQTEAQQPSPQLSFLPPFSDLHMGWALIPKSRPIRLPLSCFPRFLPFPVICLVMPGARDSQLSPHLSTSSPFSPALPRPKNRAALYLLPP